MQAHLITPPSVPVMAIAECRAMVPAIDADTSDALLAAAIDAVTGTLDAASGGWLGRALRPQTWELRLPGFPSADPRSLGPFSAYAAIRLPYPPVTAVTSIKYDDTSGTEQTLVLETDYTVFDLGDKDMTTIRPPYQGIWPIARWYPESVRIRYVAGYVLTPADLMPANIKAAVALGVQYLRSNTERSLYQSAEEIPGVLGRRWVVSDAAGAAIERVSSNLLGGLRVYR